ncbi:tryptophan--tRNA ligase [Arthrobacter sp. UM1]|uniref:tryptophan--tRNA ligase n=1 Tax=Arthrobacter sp. UM1 TaxID=2766776 RepID=UPI001CF6064A|nr:tryptophan--tRNA ligase [Arthrobacter sp. UM1]MCB4207919.1 tryptophan--tRNA ligase [Arthrobacter sp. UM1]
MTSQPRVLSGMQPSADSLHLGNYLGALRPWVQRQSEQENFFFVPDLHSLTSRIEPGVLAERTRKTVAQYIAGGLDPEANVLFIQSHVPEHAELAWVLSCVTGFGEASRMTQFKDKTAKGGADQANVGLFTYPILMASDILLYKPDAVPVGDDQRQHVELTRTLAQRFNSRFGEVFKVPEASIPAAGARVYDLQNPTSKMSKSSESPAGRIEILDSDKQIAKRIKSAVTDAGTEIRFDREEKPGVSNLLDIYSSVTGRTVAEAEEEFAGKMYGHLKVAVAEAVVAEIAPVRERALELLADPAELDRILASGREKARAVAAATLGDVYSAVGFLRAG